MRRISNKLIFLIIFLIGSFSPIQSAWSEDAGKGRKRTNINFEDELIQGETKKPELFYLLQKKQFNFGKLIRLRENFIPEMQKTSEDVERAGP